jgi:hypothetical protein
MSWLRKLTRPLRRTIFRKENSPVPAYVREVSLDNVPNVPGMTHYRELQYMYWCCAYLHKPGRRVVELGAWMGCSTVAMATGLRQSSDPGGKLVTIDRFVWDEWAVANEAAKTIAALSSDQRARLSESDLNPQVNDSFLPIFRACTEPLKESIEAIDANLDDYQWTGEPIDVLMIDAAKSWETLDQIVRQFFPCLVDGAVVIHQDYKHWQCHWLHIVCERMIERGVLSFAENVPGFCTHGFRFHKTADFDASDYLSSAFSPAESEQLIRRSMDRFRPPSDRLAVSGVYVNYLKLIGKDEQARLAFMNAIREGGFADNWFLKEFLAENADWAKPFARALFNAMRPHVDTDGSGINFCGEASLEFKVPNNGKTAAFDAPSIITSGASELVLHFWRDASASGDARRIRVEATDRAQSTVFYDEEFLMLPDNVQPIAIPLANRSNVGIRWRVVSVGSSTDEQPMRCIGPVLLVA